MSDANRSARAVAPLDVFQCDLDGVQLVEASAGTGKTWNLCGLYLRLLLERGLDVRGILVVTFTNAATAELRERIRARLVETRRRLAGEGAEGGDPFVPELLAAVRRRTGLADDALANRLEAAIAWFDEAAIHTIHGFCKRALDDVPFAARMPLSTELLQDDESLRHEAAADFWRRRVAVDALAPQLRALLLERKDSPERFARLLKRHQARPLARLLWPGRIDEGAPLDVAGLAAAHGRAAALWRADRDAIVRSVIDAIAPALNGSTYKESTVASAAAQWDDLLAGEDAAAALGAPDRDARRLSARTLGEKTRKDKHALTPRHEFFDAAQALLDARDAARETLELARLRLLRELVVDGVAGLRAAKRERRVVSFEDMLQNLHDRLASDASPWLAAELRQRYPAALIDEFQDTDPLQFGIFDRIYGGEGTLFLVGDPKQAIYGFRNADLHTYLAARDRAHAEYTLEENQRSSEPLLAALNALFGANERVFMLPGLDYRAVRCGGKPRSRFEDLTEPRAPLHVWTLPGTLGECALVGKPHADDAAAHATAGEIARMLAAARAGRITLDGSPLQARHVAVLVRTHAEGARMRAALAAVGVGCVELSQASVFASPDAEELERVMAAVLAPGRGGLVKAALATQTMGLDAAAVHALGEDESAFSAHVQFFAELRDAWFHRGAGFMLRDWLARAGVARRLLARADGERRLTNLLHLFECVQQAASAHESPDALLEWLRAQRRERGGGDAAQLRLESDRNLVQIVTIHSAKGLEYPVVFCPYLWTGRLSGAPNDLDGVEYHDEKGVAVVDFREGLDPLFDDDAVSAQRKLEASAEFLRLVYVALTRAVHRCVLVAGCYVSGGAASTAESVRSLLNWMVAGGARSPTEWLGDKPRRDAAGHAAAALAIGDAWAKFAQAQGGGVAIEPMPLGAGAPLAPDAAAPERLAALAAPARIAPAWRIGSYSSLAHGAAADAAADHDLRAARGAALSAEALASLAPDDVMRFPRGAAAGECIHAVFEHADFTDPATWPAAVDDALRDLRGGAPPAPGADPRAPMLLRMLEDVLATPLPVPATSPLSLATVTRARRLNELEFHFPCARLNAGALDALLERHGYDCPRLGFSQLDGWLKGFVDLVCEHEGRFFVVDWKSNHLGVQPAHYGQAALADEMASQGYHLQHLVYCVALDRYLRHRVAGYAYEKHFGGVAYLFVRGVRPGWTVDGVPAGAFLHRPAAEAIAELSALFGEGGPGRA